MAGPRDAPPLDDVRRLSFAAVSAAFASLGRVCLGLDGAFRVRHASTLLDELAGPGVTARILGRPVEELLGSELFGAAGTLRAALGAGERREGWRASLNLAPDGSRLVSVTAAPLRHGPGDACDPDVAYLVVLRPAEEDQALTDGSPTSLHGVVARSPAMLRVLRLVDDLQQSEATVLLSGESGTGKEVVARALHARSPRRAGPFVAVNCGAIPDELLESELFGHVRGAFTGAVRDRTGRFELAAGGTIFLDEIGDLPLRLQVKLLRVLQERTFERVGESESRRADVRVIAATNVDLPLAVRDGRFRDDLYYRLRVVPIELAPLRARREDVEPLAGALLARVGARHGRALRLSPDALRAMLRYSWPGNVRELENALEYAVAVCKGQTILPEDLPQEVAETAGPAAVPPPVTVEPAERDRLRAALDAHRWNRDAAARALGMSRTTLWRKMRELGLTR